MQPEPREQNVRTPINNEPQQIDGPAEPQDAINMQRLSSQPDQSPFDRVGDPVPNWSSTFWDYSSQ